MKNATEQEAKRSKLKPSSQTEEQDIVSLIEMHHQPIKELIDKMKEDDAELPEVQVAYAELCPILKAHSEAEEETLYVSFKASDDMAVEGHEGDTEHAIVANLMKEIDSIQGNGEMFKAKCKVLAELVEHHIEEEEEEMLPDFKKESSKEERAKLGTSYLNLFESKLKMN